MGDCAIAWGYAWMGMNVTTGRRWPAREEEEELCAEDEGKTSCGDGEVIYASMKLRRR